MENISNPKVNTLEGMNDKLSNHRRDGNSTKLIDNAIQIIFSGNTCVVLDHHEMGKHKIANRNLFERILKRLYNEHWVDDKDLIIDKNKLEITLVKSKLY